MRNFLISISFLFCLTAHSKTLAINIGLECKGCELGLLKGVAADLKFYEELSNKMNVDRSITIDEKKWAEVGGKSSILNLIKDISKDYDTVVFHYSGHGLPVPLRANVINKTNDPKFNSSDFELGLIGQDFSNCFKNVNYEDECGVLCKNAEGIKPGCNLEFVKKDAQCAQKCSNKYQEKKLSNPNLDYSYASQCIAKNCRLVSAQMEKICQQNSFHIDLCKAACESRNYSPLSDRFTNSQVSECIAKNAILRSDLEQIFMGKKFYGFIDSCYSGLMSNMKHDNAVIAVAASALELAKDTGTRGGDFTLAKKAQLEGNLCKEHLTVEEFYLNSTKLKQQTPEFKKIGARQNDSASELTFIGLKCSTISTTSQPNSDSPKRNAQ